MSTELLDSKSETMSRDEFVAAIDTLGVPMRDAARLLGLHFTTTYRFARGEQAVPLSVTLALRNLLRLQEIEQPPVKKPSARDDNKVVARLERLESKMDALLSAPVAATTPIAPAPVLTAERIVALITALEALLEERAGETGNDDKFVFEPDAAVEAKSSKKRAQPKQTAAWRGGGKTPRP